MKKRLKVCLVTGASSGLGREVAKLLCEKNFIVYVTARHREDLILLQKECSKFEGKIKVADGDLRNFRFREKLISRIINEQGQIDYLINNAGFGRSTKFEDTDFEDLEGMIQLNVVAYQHLAALALKQMKKQNSGRIINVGSVVAFTPLPYFTTYDSTKAAIYSFNRALRYELKNSKITSTVVLPARMKTGFADKAYHCKSKEKEKMCAEEFNKIAGSPYFVAKKIMRYLDSGKEVITPTGKSKLWYFMRYFGFLIDFIMKNFLGPKELKNIKKMR